MSRKIFTKYFYRYYNKLYISSRIGKEARRNLPIRFYQKDAKDWIQIVTTDLDLIGQKIL